MIGEDGGPRGHESRRAQAHRLEQHDGEALVRTRAEDGPRARHGRRLLVFGEISEIAHAGDARVFHGQGAEKPETRDWTPIEVEARSACIEPDEWASLPTVLGQRDAARLRRR